MSVLDRVFVRLGKENKARLELLQLSVAGGTFKDTKSLLVIMVKEMLIYIVIIIWCKFSL